MSALAPSPLLSRRTRWPVPVTLAVLMHLTAVVLLWSAWRATNDSQPAFAPMIVRWLTAPVVHEEDATRPPPAEPRRAEPPASFKARSTSQAATSRLASTTAPQPQAPADVSGTVPATTAPAGQPLNLDPDTIARAAKDVVHNPSLSRRSDDIVGKTEPPTKQEVLAARVAQSAKKDCLKGDYEGKNDGSYKPRLGGLFEIPFLVADAVTGKCRN
ncbi:hypothetical protein [Piscinibacter terrae]|uniref:Uncharacterized protein n=1 Tax=Piscinibacter terrae TaxID=2496871 RepID=A0A3N7IUN0_9BURK|nr:hypothetical protein [Albitalea terrae]RQP22542.1 hypothetical protein DZC73_23255 [Albitalea terrae]